jgi:hypothetical protein
MKIKYVTEVQAYAAPTDIDVDSMCIDILFFNDSGSTIFINGFPVAASGTLEINGNEQEINTTKYKIGWNGALNGQCIVIRRKYA